MEKKEFALSVGEAAELLGLTPAGVRWLIRNGKLVAKDMGNAWALYPPSVYEEKKKRGLEVPAPSQS